MAEVLKSLSFDEMLKTSYVVVSRDQEMDLELLVDVILSHWKPSSSTVLENIPLDPLNMIQAQTPQGFAYRY